MMSGDKCLPGPEGVSPPKGPILFLILTAVTLTQAIDKNSYFEPLFFPADCAMLGFPNATINVCGYCTGGGTGLGPDYGKDCTGTCHGTARKDCNGQCAGTAYIDECTGQCIGGTTGRTEADIKAARDCRGDCVDENAEDVYELDACGICRVQEANNRDKRSQFRDCNGQCYAPGTNSKMGRLVCDICVGGNTNLNDSDVLDECGDCKNQPNKSATVCIGCKTEDLDECGVCHGNGSTCIKITNVHPRVLPSKDGKKKKGKQKQVPPSSYKVVLKGAFMGQRENITCVFTSLDSGNETTVKAMNDTWPGCKVSLAAGHYSIGVRVMRSDGVHEDMSDHVLVVYDHNVTFQSMTPVEAPYYTNDDLGYVVLKFTGIKTENLPLICIVQGKNSAWPKSKSHLYGSPDAPNTCNIPYQTSSAKLLIFPTYDGIHKLHPKGFEFKFYAPAPKIVNAHLVEDGTALIVVFNRSVSLCQLNKCSCLDVLQNTTLDIIGWDSVCKWATKVQLVIFVPQPLTETVDIEFKSGVLVEDMQIVAIPATEGLTITAKRVSPTTDHQQLVELTGPTQVPFCGRFHLFGHYTSPQGGSAKFTWSASRYDRGPMSTELQKALKETAEATLTLEAEWLEVGVFYSFQFLLTPLLGEVVFKEHSLVRMPYKGPIVTAFSSALLSSGPILPNLEVILYRELTVPDCAASASRTVAFWSTPNATVLFDFKSAGSPVYRIAPNTLPPNSVVQFVATAFLSNRINETTSAIVNLRVGHVPPHAFIKGNPVRVVGSAMHVNSSVITLKSSLQVSEGTSVRYKWSCIDKDLQPCYNFGPYSNSTLLLDRSNQTNPNVSFRSQQLKPGQELNFTLQVFYADDPNNFSSISTALVKVVPGNIPQVVIYEVSYRGIRIRGPNSRGHYHVPATAAVAVDARVLGYHGKDRKFGKWTWTVQGMPEMALVASSEQKTHLLLPEGTTVAHGVYVVNLNVCNGKMTICNNATVTLFATPGVTACKLQVDPYEALDMTEARVSGCSISHDRSPVVYQLFLVNQRSRTPITGPQFSNVFHFAGPPDEFGAGLIFAVQVCDKISVCTVYNSNVVSVESPRDLNDSATALVDRAKNALIAGDPIQSLSLVSVAAMASNDSSLREQITKYARDAISNLPLLPGQVALLYSSLQSLFEDPNSDNIMKALDAIKAATQKAAGLKMIPPIEAINQAYALTTKLIRYYPDNVVLLAKVSDVQVTLVSTLATTVPLAQRVELRPDEENGPVLFLYHTYFNTEAFQLKYNPQAKAVDVSVRFSQKVRDKVNTWDCKNNPCHQVAVVFELFPGDSLFPEEEDERRVSPVVTINLFSPADGKELHINEKEGITMYLRQTANQTKLAGKVTKCHMWDETKRMWTMEPVTTLGTTGGNVQCVSSQDGIFAAIEVSLGLSGGAIAGIIVATLMFLTIMGMIVMFFLRQKKANKAAARASNSTQALKEGDQMNSVYPA